MNGAGRTLVDEYDKAMETSAKRILDPIREIAEKNGRSGSTISDRAMSGISA